MGKSFSWEYSELLLFAVMTCLDVFSECHKSFAVIVNDGRPHIVAASITMLIDGRQHGGFIASISMLSYDEIAVSGFTQMTTHTHTH